ncbi:MAG: glycosyltransferase [Mobilitalea sp.]
MNILQVDNSDLVGRIFNGHDLQISLNELGYNSYQAVKYKYGSEDTTSVIGKLSTEYMDRYIGNMERELSMNSMLGVWDRYLENSKEFETADIVHYHKIHAGIMSLLRFPRLLEKKASVWTVHDPWAFTGHCVHPLECDKWINGCEGCPHLSDYYFPLKQDKASQLWNVKKRAYKDINIDIVVSTLFMEEYIKKSPLTSHLKRIHRIPFGVRLEHFNQFNKQEVRKNWNISSEDIVIGFRNDDYLIKGCSYIFEALDSITNNRIVILTVGEGKLPLNIKSKFRSIELGWQNNADILSKFYSTCDIFLMPSLAESFGMMAIEAMASECSVIVFKNTVLESLVFSPECGIAVDYKSSQAIVKAITTLLQNPMECKIRGEKSRRVVEEKYCYKDYVRKHVELYEEIFERNRIKKEVKK